MNQGALHFDALLSVNNFDAGITRIKNSIREASGVAKKEAQEMDNSFRALGTAIGGYFTAQTLFSFTKELINVRGEFQKTEIAFSTMLGSGDKAKVLMGQMVDLAAKTPFDLKEVSSGAKQLLAFQVPANEVVDTLTRMGNIAAGLSVPISRINLVFGQVKAKGRLMGDDLRQFTEAGIPMVAELAKKFNKTTAEISDMVSVGKIGFNDVKEVLFAMTNEGGMFFNLMEKQSTSLSGRIANLGDNWQQMLNKIGESNEGVLYGGIEALNYLIENYQQVLNTIESLIVVYGSYRTALIVTSAAQNFANKTVQSEIALLSISEKMKLGRAMVTQRQAEATAREAAAEVENVKAKFAALRAENAVLIAKKESLRQAGLTTMAKWQEARLQLRLAQLELSSIQATGTAREVEIAQKRVTIAQNAVLSTQATATIAKNAAVANSVAIWTNKEVLKNTTQAIGAAQGAATVASEAAQTAAKNANAIATTRLTIATRLRTAATQLATAAQAILNATMLNNPIVIVIAAAAALTYAYFRLRDTSTALTIAEKLLNDEREKSTKLIDDLKNKTQELTAVINSDTSTKLQQYEAYKQMQSMYPDMLKDMDVETFKKLGATEAQKKLNAEIDKFSTLNLKKQIENSNKSIDDLNVKIAELNERLKKRDGDSGIYLNELELAKKNLEAQKINLEKYNAEYRQRLENEKISSMSLEQQKKYWEDQIISISNQISGLEKSNSKKAEGIDKLNNMNSLIKTTSVNLLNWNISPLLSQLERARNEVFKINNVSNPNIDKNKAYWEQQRKAAEDLVATMTTSQKGTPAWNEAAKKWKEADAELKKYDLSDRQLLKDEKARAAERKKLDKGAEKSFLQGSLKSYDQKINLLEEALSRSNGKDVRLRYFDKYGKERNSEEVRSVKSVQDELVKLREERAEREKLIEVKSFKDTLEEAERQWNNYYKMAEFYGKETADAQYKELFKGSQSYLEYLEKTQTALSFKKDSGQLFTETDKNNLVDVTEKINHLTGVKTPLENFKKDIENSLKELPALTDQITLLDQELAKAQLQEGNVNTAELLGKTNLIKEKKEEILNLQKDLYREFLNEQKTFEDKKNEVEKKYSLIRDEIAKNQAITESERLRQLNASYKKEGEEITELNLEGIRKTDLWKKAFGDLSTSGVSSLKRLKKYLVDYLQANKNLPPTEVEAISNQIKNIENSLKEDPFEKISLATQNYKNKLDELGKAEKKFSKDKPEFKAALDDTRLGFIGIMEAANDAAQFMLNAVVTSIDAFGGISDEAKQTIGEIQNLAEGVISAVKGFYSGNYGEAVTGIVQALSALGKLMNGDFDRERHIKTWQIAVDELKDSYQNLLYVIEKTAGEDQIKNQRELIANLKEQQKVLDKMRSSEADKKNHDTGKIASYTQQINEISQQIKELIDDFQSSITTTEFRELSQRLSDALIEAFGKGEDAASSFEKVVDDVMRNAVANALRIKILEPAVKSMVDSIYTSMGFGGNSGATAEQAAMLKDYKDQIAEIDKKLPTANSIIASDLNNLKNYLLDKIKIINQQIAANAMSGSFDGLTKEERDKIKEQGVSAMQQYTAALQQYQDLFGAASENAQGMKGDIKGVTEKTAGALEAQFNAVRINIVAILKIHQANQNTFKNQLNTLSQIEINTRNLVSIRKDISELNQKVKKGAAGIP